MQQNPFQLEYVVSLVLKINFFKSRNVVADVELVFRGEPFLWTALRASHRLCQVIFVPDYTDTPVSHTLR